jgi:hypothetical protein
MEQAVRDIIEKDKIIEIVNQLFIGTDNRNWKTVRDCFTDKVLFDMTSMTGGKPGEIPADKIVEGWNQGLKNLQHIHHQAGNYLVNIKQDTADVFCYGTAYHYLENSSGRNSRTFVGSYDFQLKQIAYKWKICKFKFNLKFIEGNKELGS